MAFQAKGCRLTMKEDGHALGPDLNEERRMLPAGFNGVGDEWPIVG